MNKTLITFFTLLFFLTSSVGWSIEYKDLVERDGIYYKKFIDGPFTGKIEGKEQGLIKNGKKEGLWIEYHTNGYLKSKGKFENGNKEGTWVKYYSNKQLKSKGKFENGNKEGLRIKYYSNGQLKSKGDFINSNKEGSWEWYNLDGTIDGKKYGIWKNNKKISD